MNLFEQLEILENPDRMVQAVLKLLREADLEIGNEKTVAEIIRYDSKVATGLTPEFFTGTFVAAGTNMVGSYTPNNTEHMVIWGIRVLTGTAATISETVWDPGSYGLAGVVNMDITVNINGVNELVRYPCTQALSALTTRDDGLMPLNKVLIWPAQTNLVIAPTLTVVGGANTNIRIELKGMGLTA